MPKGTRKGATVQSGIVGSLMVDDPRKPKDMWTDKGEARRKIGDKGLEAVRKTQDRNIHDSKAHKGKPGYAGYQSDEISASNAEGKLAEVKAEDKEHADEFVNMVSRAAKSAAKGGRSVVNRSNFK